MQRLIVFLGFVAIAFGADNNCTDPALNLDFTATACLDVNPDVCPLLFGATPVVYGAAATTRNAECTQSTAMKKVAIENCARHCGFCCQTPPFNCKNKEIPRFLNCDVKQSMCSQSRYRLIIAEDCPNKCGFCLEGGCVDKVTDCSTSFCLVGPLAPFVEENCRRTCNLCSSPAVTTITPRVTTRSTPCFDANPNCASWVKHNFCTNPFYDKPNNQVRRDYCAKSCGLC